jgi:hypothetical protein
MKYEGGSPPPNQHDKLETFVSKLPHTTKNLTDLLKAQIAITAQEPLLDLYIGLLNYRPGTVSNGELAALFTALDSANDAAVRLLRRRNKFGQNCNPPNVQIKTQTQGQHHK